MVTKHRRAKRPETAADVLAFNLALQLIVYRAGALVREGEVDEPAAERRVVASFCEELRKTPAGDDDRKAYVRAANLVEREAAGIWQRRRAREAGAA
jgi:hypothetical protein